MLKKSLCNTVLGTTLGFFALIGNALAGDMVSGDNPNTAMTDKTVSMAIKSLGLNAEKHTDKKGNPHFVINGPVSGAESISVFMDDCGKAGCEDIILYSKLGKSKELSDKALNEWNHIGSKLRSKMARSDNGEIGITMPISLYGNAEQEKVAMLLGLFVVETKWASDTIHR